MRHSRLVLPLLAVPGLLFTALPGRAGGPARNKLPADQALRLLKAERDPYWLRAQETVYRSVLSLTSQHGEEQKRGLGYDKLMRGDPTRREVALTFDDGPHPAYTPRLLQILRRYKAPATFFLVGEMAERFPDMVRAEVADGHTVANHTYHHVNLRKIPATYVPVEIKACGEVLKGITGKAPHLFRPPGGQYDGAVAEAAQALGYKLILWTDDPGDYASPGGLVIEQRTLAALSNGGILLLHDGIDQTLAVLPDLLQYLKDHGFTLVTVDQMLRGRDAGRRAAGDDALVEGGVRCGG